jgi:hypothetical protein
MSGDEAFSEDWTGDGSEQARGESASSSANGDEVDPMSHVGRLPAGLTEDQILQMESVGVLIDRKAETRGAKGKGRKGGAPPADEDGVAFTVPSASGRAAEVVYPQDEGWDDSALMKAYDRAVKGKKQAKAAKAPKAAALQDHHQHPHPHHHPHSQAEPLFINDGVTMPRPQSGSSRPPSAAAYTSATHPHPASSSPLPPRPVSHKEARRTFSPPTPHQSPAPEQHQYQQHQYQQQYQYQQAGPMMPPLPAGLEDEALSSLLMAWYYSGYYTGRYQAIRELSKK